MNGFSSLRRNSIPSLGLLALALTLVFYTFDQAGFAILSVSGLGMVLLLGGGLQILTALRIRKAGASSASAALLPLGLFWMSMIGFEIFPRLGIGKHPSSVAMVAYLSMWGFFAALLFLSSFRQSKALQLVFAGLMICLLSLALGVLKENSTLQLCGSVAGILSGAAAGYTALAQLLNQWAGRSVFPVGYWQGSLDEDAEEQLAP